VYGYDSQTQRLMVSSDRTTWERRAQIPLADFAVSPGDPEELLATSEQGLARSSDGGATWTTRGKVPGAPEGLSAHEPSELYVATETGGHRSTDGGRTFISVSP
jgi:hypothetical protein